MKTPLKRLWTLLLGVVSLLVALATRAQQPAFLTNGLVAYYPFNGNAKDESGNNRNGTAIGPSLALDRFGVENKSYYFDGNDYIEIPDRRILDNQRSIAISAWYRFQDSQGGQIFSAGDYRGGDDPIHMYLDPNRLGAFNLGDTVQDGWFPSPSLPLVYTNQGWHQIVLVLDGAENKSSLIVYQDGIVIAETNRPVGFKITYDRDMSALIGAIEGRPFYSSPSQFWKGWLDDLRIYNRALSDTEVKALYDYENVPQPSNTRIAIATAQVVNGFVVGATVTDGGYGYTNTPSVTINGGGGSGATARATVVNGSVTAITILTTGNGYTSTPTITIAPPPFPPRKATATSQVINGFVVGATVSDGGFGYTQPPNVLLIGGGGSGATATATVQNGVVTGITIVNSGAGYTSAPTVRIASPPFNPSLSVEVSRVNVTLNVVQGLKYQLESTADMITWTPTGPAFVAEDESLIQEFPVNTTGRYFRIRQAP